MMVFIKYERCIVGPVILMTLLTKRACAAIATIVAVATFVVFDKMQNAQDCAVDGHTNEVRCNRFHIVFCYVEIKQ